MDYKTTVNLPKTEFPMRANLPEREPLVLERWERMDLYGKMRAAAAGRPKFILHDGPPYANGNLHAGTALNKVLKDFVVKSKQMGGLDAPFVPGWDCHGLPIEHKVIGDLGEDERTLTKVEIRRKCREFALKFVDIHRTDFKRLGVTGQWDRPYLTLAPEYVATIIRVFAEMYWAGRVYKGLKPIYWCTSCETALAEAEVEYASRVSPSVYVKFEAVDPIPGVAGKVYWVIWTTTPWTLPANLAISVHPEFEYSAIDIGDETLVMADYLAPGALEACGITEFKRVRKFSGKELEGLTYRHCTFPERICPIILGEHVTLDTGTGCVHTAPGHGQEDYVVGARYGIAPMSPVDAKGVFTEEAGPYAGQFVFDANKQIIEDLRSKGALLGSSKVEHSYAHCWRCMNPVIYRATPQWFISLEHKGLREKALQAVGMVDWIPDWGQERIHSMIAQRPDWCISRQRVWGVPIPVFLCQRCNAAYATSASFTKIEELALSAPDGIDRWFDTPASQLLPEGAACAECGGTEFRAETDILDVWFDSGISHRAVCENNPKLSWPVDMYLEGTDQHRGWFQLSLLLAIATRGKAPYRTVLTHGYVVDGEGKKLSKKLGNYLELPDLLAKYGAEIVRLWAASENFQQDIRISEEIITRLQDTYRRIRNTIRYMLGNLGDFGPQNAVPYAELEEVDRWALHQMQVLREKVVNAYAAYDFHVIYHAANNFCTVEMGAFYLDILKDRLYTFASDSRERRAGQTVIASLVVDLLKLLAPILPFTCDEAWQHLPLHLKTAESVHLSQFPEPKHEYRLSGTVLANWDDLFRIRGIVSKALETARREQLIGSSLEAAVTLAPGNAAVEALLRTYASQLPWVFIVSTCSLAPISEAAKDSDDKLLVTIAKASGRKCIRCWNYGESVGSIPQHPDICVRCAKQLGVMRL